MLAISALAIPLTAVVRWVADSLSPLRPLKYDQFVYRFDALLGQPSFALGAAVYRSPLLMDLVGIAYDMMTAMMVLAIGAYLWLKTDEEVGLLLKALLFNLLFALPLYLLFPVCGPRFAFAGFPFEHPAHVIPHPIALVAAPNGVPSVHTSTALVLLWFLRDWWWGRLVGWTFLALTIFATLGSGQHYLFDLLCALPYTVSVLALANHLRVYVPTEKRVGTTAG
jgi:hypothetical protein